MPSEKPFLSFVIEEELLQRIDEYRYDNRIPSRSQAIRDLLRAALDASNIPRP